MNREERQQEWRRHIAAWRIASRINDHYFDEGYDIPAIEVSYAEALLDDVDMWIADSEAEASKTIELIAECQQCEWARALTKFTLRHNSRIANDFLESKLEEILHLATLPPQEALDLVKQQHSEIYIAIRFHFIRKMHITQKEMDMLNMLFRDKKPVDETCDQLDLYYVDFCDKVSAACYKIVRWAEYLQDVYDPIGDED